MVRARIGDTVKVHYEGRLADGTVFASSIDRDPAELTIGAWSVITTFAKAIVGMAPDESKTVRIPVAEALEQHREELVPTVSQEPLAADVQRTVGQRLQAIDTDGRSVYVTVRGISQQAAMIDANSPFAGEDLTFDILLVEIM